MIAEGFDRFLLDWEALCYVHPLHLGKFLKEPKGNLDPQGEWARLLRELIAEALDLGKQTSQT